MAENKMFCFQCQETAKGTGCTIQGVCGKKADTSRWQDLLLAVTRGIGTIADSLRNSGIETSQESLLVINLANDLCLPSYHIHLE